MSPQQHDDVDLALLAYWTARDEARIEQAARGVTDQGARAGVTSGGHLDRIAQLLARVCRAAGAPTDQVFYKAPKGDPHKRAGMQSGCTLPGYYRPTKDWDLVVWRGGEPIVVVELKSQNGPSYGNNANNRAEEAIGNAVDLQRAVATGLLPAMPWVGYAFVIEDDGLSDRKRGESVRGSLALDPIFEGWSYVERVRQLSARLAEDALYSGVWPVATSRPTCPDAGRSTSAKSACPQRQSGVANCSHDFSWRELDAAAYGYGAFVEGMTDAIRRAYRP